MSSSVRTTMTREITNVSPNSLTAHALKELLAGAPDNARVTLSVYSDPREGSSYSVKVSWTDGIARPGE